MLLDRDIENLESFYSSGFSSSTSILKLSIFPFENPKLI
jgi:hypothetical protein